MASIKSHTQYKLATECWTRSHWAEIAHMKSQNTRHEQRYSKTSRTTDCIRCTNAPVVAETDKSIASTSGSYVKSICSRVCCENSSVSSRVKNGPCGFEIDYTRQELYSSPLLDIDAAIKTYRNTVTTANLKRNNNAASSTETTPLATTHCTGCTSFEP